MGSDLKMLCPLAEGVGILAGETPPEMAADPAGAFSCLALNEVHGIWVVILHGWWVITSQLRLRRFTVY
jgi:hypothetical protein